MSRSLVLGNGNLLVCIDEFGQVRDFYFPHVGLENHAGRDLVHKIGVWVDQPAGQGSGAFSWLDDGTWETSVSYQHETMASNIVAVSGSLKLRLKFLDVVYNETDIFLRTVEIEDMAGRARHAKVFFNQQFRISENEHADTAYYNPTVEAVIHYKGRRVFLVGGEIGGRSFDEYSIGLFRIEGKEGAWRDAEDGVLSKNPIEHGSVDSIIGFSTEIPPSGNVGFSYWICTGRTYKEVQVLQRYIHAKTPGHLAETTQDFWHAWVNQEHFSFIGLDQDSIKLFKNSLLIMRTHCDNGGGGILASGDSGNFQYGRDTYAYIWPRDAAFAALALGHAGYHDIAERFYSFANGVVTEEGYVMHKYQPNRALGSSWHPWVNDGKKQLAIQEDETAVLIFAFWEHYREAKDLEFVEKIYNDFIKRCTEFMLAYRDMETNLPLPSYDLWEEHYSVSTFTASSVYGGLIAASYFASLLGKDEDRIRYAAEAEKVRLAILAYLYNPDVGHFSKRIVLAESGSGKGIERDDTCDASAFYGIFRFGVLPPEDPKLVSSYEFTIRELSKNVQIGGVGRYAGDAYFRVAPDAPGNPWFITSLWAMQYRLALAKTKEDMEAASRDIAWAAKYALQSGLLSEQLHPFTGGQLSVSPLTWSHAEYVTTVLLYMEQLEKLGLGLKTYPVE